MFVHHVCSVILLKYDFNGRRVMIKLRSKDRANISVSKLIYGMIGFSKITYRIVSTFPNFHFYKIGFTTIVLSKRGLSDIAQEPLFSPIVECTLALRHGN